MRKILLISLLAVSGSIFSSMLAQNAYKDPAAVNQWIKSVATTNSNQVKIHKIAVSPGGTDVKLLEIGTEISSTNKTNPAVLLVANMNGLRPITTEGAIYLCEELLKDQERFADRTWYVLPLGNPDAAARYFGKVKMANPTNALPVNNDMDENTDEDGYNDLNGDGYITLMRQKHPDGNMIVVDSEPRLMRKAKASEGETGVYRIFTEGLDDDDDGKYNEDLAGGTNVNLNFPHLFKNFDTSTGLYPGSTPEARGILEFAYTHPEIAMAVAFGETNFCYTAPKGGRKGEADLSRIKVPQRTARMFGADPNKTYNMEEIMELVSASAPPGMEITESMVIGFLGLGAAVNPEKGDLEFYNKLSKEYQEYLEEKGAKAERFDPEKAKDGSFELWAYYHLGVPVFSMDLFAIPKTEKKKTENKGMDPDEVKDMSTDEFVALGEEKINEFLKAQGAPEQMNAERVIAMMKAGQADPGKMVEMMKKMPKKGNDDKGADEVELAKLAFSDEVLDGKGFIEWQAYSHPQLGEVEIGGFTPYMESTPPYSMVDSLLELQVPWILKIADQLPDLGIKEVRQTALGGGIYKIEAWIENTQLIPFPTAMGERNNQPAPAVITLNAEGLEVLEGLKRTPVKAVAGHSSKKLTWLIRADKKTGLTLELSSKAAGNDVKTINIGG